MRNAEREFAHVRIWMWVRETIWENYLQLAIWKFFPCRRRRFLSLHKGTSMTRKSGKRRRRRRSSCADLLRLPLYTLPLTPSLSEQKPTMKFWNWLCIPGQKEENGDEEEVNCKKEGKIEKRERFHLHRKSITRWMRGAWHFLPNGFSNPSFSILWESSQV